MRARQDRGLRGEGADLVKGPAIDALSKSACDRGDIVAQYIFDIIGSEIAEAAADLVGKKIEEHVVQAGFAVTTTKGSIGYAAHVGNQGLVPPLKTASAKTVR